MKWIIPPLFGISLLAACAGKPAAVTDPAVTALPMDRQLPPYQILDYQGKELGGDIPEWVTRYIDGGIAGVESLPQYQGVYVFIEENSGRNSNALTQWSLGFIVDQDFPQMVSSRVQARLIRTGAGNFDRVYGRYFENLVKNTFDTSYFGAQRTADFWILKQHVLEDGTMEEQAMYNFFVLVQIEKNDLKNQLNNILYWTGTATPVTREQTAAIERLKANFYEGF